MPRLSQAGPGRLKVREGGGVLAVFGLPFLITGLGIMLALLGGVPLQDAETAAWFARPLMWVMGLVFACVGGGLVFGRTWTTFDANARTIVTQMGLLAPMSTTTHRLDDYTNVVLGFQHGDSDSADQFSISLKARSGSDLRLFSSTQYAESREHASAIASLLHLDIEDQSTDHTVKLSAAEAKMSLQDRLRLDHRRGTPVARPVKMRSEITAGNGKVVIVIPPKRVHPALFLVFLIPAAVPIFFVAPFFRFFRQTNTPDVVSWVFLGFLTVAFGVLPVWSGLNAFLKSRRGRTIVTVSTSGIRVEERRVWKTRLRQSLEAADVMDIDYSTSDSLLQSVRQRAAESPANEGHVSPVVEGTLVAISKIVDRGAVTVKTRKGLTTFGEGLGDDEIRYVHSVVRHAILYDGLP